MILGILVDERFFRKPYIHTFLIHTGRSFKTMRNPPRTEIVAQNAEC